jgi:Kef-type K+ transport system membrane component KefB
MNRASSRRATVPVVLVAVVAGLGIGAAIGFGSQNLVMGATTGGILMLLFGGLAAYTAQLPAPGRRRETTDGGAVVFGTAGGYGGSDGGCSDAGGDGGGGGGDGGC